MGREEVIKQRAAFDKSRLEGVDQIPEHPLKPGGEHLGDDLRKAVDQTNRTVVTHD